MLLEFIVFFESIGFNPSNPSNPSNRINPSNLSGLARSNSIRGEMRPALWNNDSIIGLFKGDMLVGNPFLWQDDSNKLIQQGLPRVVWKLLHQGAYFIGTQATQVIYPVKCEAYFTGTQVTQATQATQ